MRSVNGDINNVINGWSYSNLFFTYTGSFQEHSCRIYICNR